MGQPLNAEERYLHGINVRLECLIDMFSSFLDVYAKETQTATVQNEVVQAVKEETVKEEEKEQEEDIDYNEFTKAELSEMLDEKGIEYTTRDTKAELIKLIK